MIEIFTALGMSEVGAYIVSLGSPILCLLALVVVAFVAIFKITKVVKELRNTDEIKALINQLEVEHKDNIALKKINKKLTEEISKKIDLFGGDKDD